MKRLEIDTPHGPAAAELHHPEEPRAGLVLGHGAGGGLAAPDLVAAKEVALSEGLSVALVEQPYRVAGRRSAAPAHQLDTAWTAVVEQLSAAELKGLPLVTGGPLGGCPRCLPHGRGHGRGGGAVHGLSPPTAPAPCKRHAGAQPPRRA